MHMFIINDMSPVLVDWLARKQAFVENISLNLILDIMLLLTNVTITSKMVDHFSYYIPS